MSSCLCRSVIVRKTECVAFGDGDVFFVECGVCNREGAFGRATVGCRNVADLCSRHAGFQTREGDAAVRSIVVGDLGTVNVIARRLAGVFRVEDERAGRELIFVVQLGHAFGELFTLVNELHGEVRAVDCRAAVGEGADRKFARRRRCGCAEDVFVNRDDVLAFVGGVFGDFDDVVIAGGKGNRAGKFNRRGDVAVLNRLNFCIGACARGDCFKAGLRIGARLARRCEGVSVAGVGLCEGSRRYIVARR